jgi:hypothetical protein
MCQVLHRGALTTEAIRQAMQHRQAKCSTRRQSNGLTTTIPGWTRTHCGPAPFTAHRKVGLRQRRA